MERPTDMRKLMEAMNAPKQLDEKGILSKGIDKLQSKYGTKKSNAAGGAKIKASKAADKLAARWEEMKAVGTESSAEALADFLSTKMSVDLNLVKQDMKAVGIEGDDTDISDDDVEKLFDKLGNDIVRRGFQKSDAESTVRSAGGSDETDKANKAKLKDIFNKLSPEAQAEVKNAFDKLKL